MKGPICPSDFNEINWQIYTVSPSPWVYMASLVPSTFNSHVCFWKQKATLHRKRWYKARHNLDWKSLGSVQLSRLKEKSSSIQGGESRVFSVYRCRGSLYNICSALSCWIIYALPFHLKLFAATAVNASVLNTVYFFHFLQKNSPLIFFIPASGQNKEILCYRKMYVDV